MALSVLVTFLRISGSIQVAYGVLAVSNWGHGVVQTGGILTAGGVLGVFLVADDVLGGLPGGRWRYGGFPEVSWWLLEDSWRQPPCSVWRPLA